MTYMYVKSSIYENDISHFNVLLKGRPLSCWLIMNFLQGRPHQNRDNVSGTTPTPQFLWSDLFDCEHYLRAWVNGYIPKCNGTQTMFFFLPRNAVKQKVGVTVPCEQTEWQIGKKDWKYYLPATSFLTVTILIRLGGILNLTTSLPTKPLVSCRSHGDPFQTCSLMTHPGPGLAPSHVKTCSLWSPDICQKAASWHLTEMLSCLFCTQTFNQPTSLYFLLVFFVSMCIVNVYFYPVIIVLMYVT